MLNAWINEWLLSQQRPAPALPGMGRAGHGSIKAGEGMLYPLVIWVWVNTYRYITIVG